MQVQNWIEIHILREREGLYAPLQRHLRAPAVLAGAHAVSQSARNMLRRYKPQLEVIDDDSVLPASSDEARKALKGHALSRKRASGLITVEEEEGPVFVARNARRRSSHATDMSLEDVNEEDTLAFNSSSEDIAAADPRGDSPLPQSPS